MSIPEAHSAPPEPWLPKKAVAAHYSTSIRTVERWLHAGCQSRLIGGMRRVRLSDAEAFLNAQDPCDGEGGR